MIGLSFWQNNAKIQHYFVIDIDFIQYLLIINQENKAITSQNVLRYNCLLIF